MKNKNKITIIIGVIGIILVIGVSYAWLKTTVYGQKEYIIKAGNLDLVLDETSNGLMIENELPVEDRVGLASDGATFQLRNHSISNICYEIYLDDAELTEAEVRVEDKFVKYSLDKNSDIGSAKVLTNAGVSPSRLIDTGEIEASKTVNYKLRLWFNAEEDGDYAGQVFKGKLRIEATQCQLPKMRSYANVVKNDGSYAEQLDYHADLYREKITSIVTKKDVNIPATAIEVSNGKGNYWDVSEKGDNSVIAYIEDDGMGNGTYKVTIGGKGRVIANPDSGWLFYRFTTLTKFDLSHFDTSNVTSMFCMFYNCSSLTSLNLNNFDTSNVTNMYHMFCYCSSLTSLDLSNFDTSKVTNVGGMFNGCSSLRNLDLSNFDTSNVTNIYGMFYSCTNLTSLDLSHFDTTKLTNMGYLFYECSSLTSLNLSNFDTSNVTDMPYMFYGCSSLTSLDLSSFDTSKVTDMSAMFYDSSNLQTIKVGNLWTTASAGTTDIFYNCGTDHVTVV